MRDLNLPEACIGEHRPERVCIGDITGTRWPLARIDVRDDEPIGEIGRGLGAIGQHLLIAMADDFNDVAEWVLAITNFYIFAWKQLPYLRSLKAAAIDDFLNLGLDIGMGNRNMEKPVLPVFHGVSTPFRLGF